MSNIENLKKEIAAKLAANQGKNSPNSLDIGMMSNSLNVKAPEKNPYSIVSKDVEIKGTIPELDKNILAPSNVHDERVRAELMARWKIEDPERYKIEAAKLNHIEYMKSLVSGYSEAEKERDKRRSK
jgi:hypothetical protein